MHWEFYKCETLPNAMKTQFPSFQKGISKNNKKLSMEEARGRFWLQILAPSGINKNEFCGNAIDSAT